MRQSRTFAIRFLVASGVLAGAGASADEAIVINTDYATGYYSRLDLAAPFASTSEVGPTCADAVARPHGDRIYVLGRFGCDFVQVIDAASFATLAQWSTGNGTNPQDIEVYSPTKAYVSLYERDYLLVVDPRTGTTLGSIDLAAFSDADGLPEAAEMARVGDRLFVALQRLDRPGGFIAANPSQVVVVNCATDQIEDADPALPGVQPIVLSGRNPISELVLDPVRDKLYVAEAGDLGVLDGGAEFIDPVGLRAEGLFVTEAQLGGDLNGVRLWTDCSGYAVVNDASYRTRLVRFDRCTGQPLGTCWQSAGFDLCDLEIDYERAQLLVSDRDLLTPGVRVFRAGACTQITAFPIDLGLPPCDIAPVASPVPASTPPPDVAKLRLSANWPDPFNPATTLRIAAAPGRRVRLEVADVRGRCVRTLWDAPLPGGECEVVWDGRDARGVGLPSGVYYARLRSGAETRTEPLTLVR